MRTYIRKVLPVVPEGTQLTGAVLIPTPVHFLLRISFGVQPRAPFVVHTDNILLILLRFLITFYSFTTIRTLLLLLHLSKTSGNSMAKIS